MIKLKTAKNLGIIALTVLVGFTYDAATGASYGAAVSCPGTSAINDREFLLTTSPDSTCLFFGSGNISGNSGDDPFLDSLVGADFKLLDKSDDTTDGLFPHLFDLNLDPSKDNTSGQFSFSLPPLDNWVFAIGFKSGNGQIDPTFAIFLLPDGVTSGSWSIDNSADNGDQDLSHANLYGAQITVVPLPAALPLLFGGLIGLVLVGCRRKPASS